MCWAPFSSHSTRTSANPLMRQIASVSLEMAPLLLAEKSTPTNQPFIYWTVTLCTVYNAYYACIVAWPLVYQTCNMGVCVFIDIWRLLYFFFVPSYLIALHLKTCLVVVGTDCIFMNICLSIIRYLKRLSPGPKLFSPKYPPFFPVWCLRWK